jgi:hypothetical protein
MKIEFELPGASSSVCPCVPHPLILLPSSGHCDSRDLTISSYLPVSLYVYLIRYDAVYFSKLFSSFSSYFWTGLIGWIQQVNQSRQVFVIFRFSVSSSQTKQTITVCILQRHITLPYPLICIPFIDKHLYTIDHRNGQ